MVRLIYISFTTDLTSSNTTNSFVRTLSLIVMARLRFTNKLYTAALIFAFATFYNSKKPKNLMDFPPIWNAYCNHVGGALATGVPLFDTMKRQWNLEPVLLEEKS
jgi:hypothetical protein